MRIAVARFAILSLGLFLAGQARADLVIDQQNTFSIGGISATNTIGQSFTPTQGKIDFATFNLAVSRTTAIQINLFDGIGYDGTKLATGPTVTVAYPGGFLLQRVEFDFSSSITLIGNHVYTLQLVGASSFQASAGNLDPYTRGNAILNSTPNDNYDLVFSEGYFAVPEPTSLVMTALGLLGGGAWKIRSRRRIA